MTPLTKLMMELYRPILVVVLASFDLLGLCVADSCCVSGYRPYTCMSCIHLTKDEKMYSHAHCESPGVLIQMQEIQSEVLQRYMEVYNGLQFWTGYEFNNGKAVVPGTNFSIDEPVNDQNCSSSSCCLALQLEPFGLISLDCDKRLPAICTTSVNYPMLSDGTGSSGTSNFSKVLVSVNDENRTLSDSQTIMFGANVTLWCTPEQEADVLWFINNEEVKINDGLQSNSKLKLVFTTPGVYQCKVSTNETTSDLKTVTLCGVDGIPGEIQSVTATPLSQTALQVTWLPPLILGTSDPLLLRYTVFYSPDGVLNENSTMKRVTPQLPKYDNEVTVQLSNLRKGHGYVVGVVVTSTPSTTQSLHFPTLITYSSTYGEAPMDSVYNLTVKRLDNDKNTLIVSWEKADLTLPEGPVLHYLVEYRDAQQTLSNTAHVPPESSLLVLWEVANANDYEVRVAIVVEVSRNPLDHRQSQWTEWVRVSGTTSEIPTGEVKPTTTKGEVKPTSSKANHADIDVIVSAVPVAVIVILVTLASAALYWRCKARREHSDIEKNGDFSILSETAEEKAVVSTDV